MLGDVMELESSQKPLNFSFALDSLNLLRREGVSSAHFFKREPGLIMDNSTL